MIINYCPICRNTLLEKTDTVISEFVKERINYNKKDEAIHLCYCKKCEFAFYDYRFSSQEENKLYEKYRDKTYQKQREKSECWYTAKVNEALNHDSKALNEQKRVITKVLSDNGFSSFPNALDYGGNEGATFCKQWGTENQYVYDISDCDVLYGIQKISDPEIIPPPEH